MVVRLLGDTDRNSVGWLPVARPWLERQIGRSACRCPLSEQRSNCRKVQSAASRYQGALRDCLTCHRRFQVMWRLPGRVGMTRPSASPCHVTKGLTSVRWGIGSRALCLPLFYGPIEQDQFTMDRGHFGYRAILFSPDREMPFWFWQPL